LPGSTEGNRRRSWWSRQSATVKAALISATGAVLAALVAAVPAVLLAPAGSRPVITNPSSTSTASVSVPASSPAAQPYVILRDDFCSNLNGWNNAAYSNCALLIRTKPNQPSGDIESSEPRASVLYPLAPSSIMVEVTARMIAGSVQGNPQFGISCRASIDPNGYGYAFIIGQNLVKIIKYSNTTGQVGQPLGQAPIKVDLTSSNLLSVACNSLAGGAAVQLALWLNHKPLLHVKDSSPVADGTVSLFAATTSNTPAPNVVQFKRFRVTSMTFNQPGSTSSPQPSQSGRSVSVTIPVSVACKWAYPGRATGKASGSAYSLVCLGTNGQVLGGFSGSHSLNVWCADPRHTNSQHLPNPELVNRSWVCTA